jgi:hypothetical protein
MQEDCKHNRKLTSLVHFNGEQFIDLNRGRRVVNKLQPISNFKASENSGKIRGCGKSFCLACCLLKP